MIHLIAAVDRNGGIGKDNDLLCHISADLKRFKSLTMGHTMLMGRKTFESLPGVLPGRPHWVLTHQKDYSVSHDAVTIFHSVAALADSLYLTEIDEAFDGADTFFPAWKKDEWEEQNRELHRPDGREKYSFSFVHYVRRFD